MKYISTCKVYIIFLFITWNLSFAYLLENFDTKSSEVKNTGLLDINFPKAVFNSKPAASITLNSQCRNEINFYVDSLEKRELWALKMYDASTKYSDGLLMGNTIELGNYDECLSIAINDGLDLFNGKYCLVNIEFPINTNEISSSASLYQLLNVSRIQTAWCLPSSCQTDDIANLLNFKLQDALGNVQVSVKNEECSINESKPLQGEDWAAITIIIIIIIVNILSTIYDLNKKKSSFDLTILSSFSLPKNGKYLLKTSKEYETIRAIPGMLFITIGWIILSSRYSLNAKMPSINMKYMENFEKDWSKLTILNGSLSYDTLFLIGGMLVCYTFFQEVEKFRTFYVPIYYIRRYVRYTPSLALVILIQATLLNYVAPGPLWASNMNEYEEACRNVWWTHLLYISNFFKTEQMCLPHTWFLSAAMQLYWISPVLLLLLWKRPGLGLHLSIILILLGWTTTFTISFLKEIPAGNWITKNHLDRSNYTYFTHFTAARYVPWIIGMLLGKYLYKAKKYGYTLSTKTIVIGWIISNTFMIGIIYAPIPFQQPDYLYNRLNSSLYLSLFRTVWVLGAAWIVIACNLGYGGLVDKILTWKIFIPLSRTSYGMFLSHVLVQNVLTHSIKVPFYLGDATTIPQFMSDMLISMGIGLVLYVILERPVRIAAICLFEQTRSPLVHPAIRTDYLSVTVTSPGAIPSTSLSDSVQEVSPGNSL